jgi:hypothetical protein
MTRKRYSVPYDQGEITFTLPEGFGEAVVAEHERMPPLRDVGAAIPRPTHVTSSQTNLGSQTTEYPGRMKRGRRLRSYRPGNEVDAVQRKVFGSDLGRLVDALACGLHLHWPAATWQTGIGGPQGIARIGSSPLGPLG